MNEQESPTQSLSLAAELQEERQARQILQAELEAFRADIWSVEEVQHALEAVNRSGSEFVIQVDQRIRTALGGLLGCLEQLQDTELSPEGQELADGASSAGQECLEVLNEVLEYCRLDAGHLVVRDEPVEAQALMDDCAGLAREALAGTPVVVEVRLGAGAPAQLRGDGRHLRKVLGHLIQNAAQHTVEGKLALGLDVVGQGQARTIQLSVADTGCGIAEEDLARVCEPFEKAGGAGLGLGLTFVRRLVQLQGGAFGLESRRGEGSTAILSFPLEAAAEGQGDAGARSIARVLVVEGDEAKQQEALGLLEQLGCQAEAVADGPAALESLQRGDYDLLLVDCMAPELDAHGVTGCIREGGAGEAYVSLPTIALIAENSSELRQDCLRAGMDDYLTLPLGLERLRSLLRIWLPPTLRPPVE
ncbi:MAG: ATP-binding protein [Planctomycetota bacterium]|nr:ATP-binding protein [Planctomycetota bacterium]